MSFFVASLCVGLGGLALMALPALRRHGHGHSHGHGRAHAARGRHAGRGHAVRGQAPTRVSFLDSALHYVPEPRLVFTLLALFGAAGNVLVRGLHVSWWLAVIGAAAAAAFAEWAVVGRLWRFAMGFGGEPTSPLDVLVTDRAEAVTPFRNGRGIVRVVRDGRAVQFGAELAGAQRTAEVRVGDSLHVEEVDTRRERLIVTLEAPRP